MSGVKESQLKRFREADWEALQFDLVKYAERKSRRKKWRSGGFLPKGYEVPDLVAIAITKTLNAILGEKVEISTWNEEVNASLIDHLKDAIDTEIANLVRSEEHKMTNYSSMVAQDEAQEIFESSVDSSGVSSSSSEMDVEHKYFEEFKGRLMQELEGDEDASLLLLVYEDLAAKNEVVKPKDASAKMGLPVEDVYNLLKKIRRAADRVSESMEEEYAK